MSERPKTGQDVGFTDFSFEAFDSAYHALEGFDGLLGVLARILSIFCELVRRCLNGAELALYVLLGGTKDFAVVLVRNPSEWLFKDQKTIEIESVSCHVYEYEEWEWKEQEQQLTGYRMTDSDSRLPLPTERARLTPWDSLCCCLCSNHHRSDIPFENSSSYCHHVQSIHTYLPPTTIPASCISRIFHHC
jgi:hypothetical protein